MSDDVVAYVEEVGGKLVLHDPNALALIAAVEKNNCRSTLECNAERVEHFKRRVAELGKKPDEVAIVLINVDDSNGGPIAEALMPGHDWQVYRDQGQIPYARGLANREWLQDVLGLFDKHAEEDLRKMSELAVVVIDRGVAAVFAA